MILTTNLSTAELTAQNNLKEQRIYSRILEMAIPVLFIGENRRLTKMKEKAKMLNTMLMKEQTERMNYIYPSHPNLTNDIFGCLYVDADVTAEFKYRDGTPCDLKMAWSS